ncbi:MAG TPA: tripartite tricarboxylate transporter substrate binding protein [Xanthobacteraceae bacterium]|nr:tripartite tricarboxylate transporter substrate binding protein [Xanthobacteraceae bacterium]
MPPSVMRSIMCAATVAWLAAGPAATAQVYPTRTVRVIIPLGPGGGGDVFTRALADELQKAWGQPVVVENRPGGGLNIGARACAESVPDGYTICVLSSEPLVYNQFLFKSLPFDPEKDFVPITNLFFNTLALVVNSALGVKTIPDLVALSRARPGTLSYGTFSSPAAHFMEKLKQQTGADMVRVPFRSGSDVVNAVLSGSTPVAVLALSNMIAQLQSGRITGLAVTSKTRSPLFPDIPTLMEARGEDYPLSWFGLFAPAATPPPIAAKIAADVQRIVGDRAFRQRMFIDRAVEPAGISLEEFARFIRDDRRNAERLVRESGLQPK